MRDRAAIRPLPRLGLQIQMMFPSSLNSSVHAELLERFKKDPKAGLKPVKG